MVGLGPDDAAAAQGDRSPSPPGELADPPPLPPVAPCRLLELEDIEEVENLEMRQSCSDSRLRHAASVTRSASSSSRPPIHTHTRSNRSGVESANSLPVIAPHRPGATPSLSLISGAMGVQVDGTRRTPFRHTQQTTPSANWCSDRGSGRSAGASTPSSGGRHTFEGRLRKAVSMANLSEATVREGLPRSNCSCRNRLAGIVSSRRFDLGVCAVVVMNAVAIGIEAEQRTVTLTWHLLDMLFTSIYVAELSARWYCHARKSCFHADPWNAFDLFVVVVALADVVLVFLGGNSSKFDSLVAGRVFRVMRIVRIVRLFRFCRELWLMVVGVAHAMKTVVWAWILLFITVYIFALLFTRMLGKKYPEDDMAAKYFGTVPRSMWTFLCIMTTEGWPDVTRAAMQLDGVWTGFVVMAFIMVTYFAIMNVVVAVVVENTLDAWVSVRDDSKKKKSGEADLRKKVYLIFMVADCDRSGCISKAQFVKAAADETVQAHFYDLGIDARMAESLFDILSGEASDTLDVATFMQGCLMVRGQALAKDMQQLKCDLKATESMVYEKVTQGIDAEFGGKLSGLMGEMESAKQDFASIHRDLRIRLGLAESPTTMALRHIEEPPPFFEMREPPQVPCMPMENQRFPARLQSPRSDFSSSESSCDLLEQASKVLAVGHE